MKPEVGDCYYHDRKEHIVVIALEKDDTILIIPITSGSYDDSCKLGIEDIIDSNGQYILKHTSYMCYRHIFEFEDFKTFDDFRKIYKYRCKLEDEILKKILDGAKKSRYIEYRFKKYFLIS